MSAYMMIRGFHERPGHLIRNCVLKHYHTSGKLTFFTEPWELLLNNQPKTEF